MSADTLTVTPEQARRLAVERQHLSGPLPGRVGKETILDVVRDLAFVQWDPVNVVAPAHELTIWSRVGPFARSDLEELLWEDKRLFQGWGHSASILLTEDYPLHYSMMRRYPECLSSSWGQWRDWTRRWLPSHRALRRAVLKELRKGHRTTGEFAEHQKTRRSGDGWSSGSDVSAMLFHLWMGGEVMVVGHEGRQNLWGLSESFLPEWVERKLLPQAEVEAQCAQRALRALGIASRSEINVSFPNGHYLDLTGAIARLEDRGLVRKVRVAGLEERGARYIHREDLDRLDSLTDTEWGERLSLLSPFDNLMTVRSRLPRLFGFDFAHENYVPKEKRKFGVYVMPILQGDRFLGRIAPRVDRERGRLVLEGVYAEKSAPMDRATGRAVGDSIERLAQFLGAQEIEYSKRVPGAWRGALR